MKRWLWIIGGLLIAGLVFATKAYWEPQTAPEVVPEVSQVSHNIRVEILNGCGTGGIATEVGQKLRDFGIDVMTLGNAENFNFPETIVIDRMGKIEYAKQVANVLGTPNVIQQKTPDPFRIEEVTVIIGRDYRGLEIFK
ncbi:MAG: LytR C-terminal domain-containing protein [Gemmatimonadota bacterium]|nr:LytR C-terminal domain-containing protein [Gemmatimonadota bacterium]MDE2830075.1 LytR C-terminal domain-containing protein [Gemmatimonadota bacterium]